MDPAVCAGLHIFQIKYEDVDSVPQNAAASLTDEGIIRLAKSCPSLNIVRLQGTRGVTDRALTAFIEHCPSICVLEISQLSHYVPSLDGTVFDVLLERPDWALQLSRLRVTDQSNDKIFMVPLRVLSQERKRLAIQLLWACETRSGEEWQIDCSVRTWHGGKEQKRWDPLSIFPPMTQAQLRRRPEA